MKTKEEILDEHSVTASGANMIPPYREDILDAMEEYANQSKWISVRDKLPDTNEDVLCWSDQMQRPIISFYDSPYGWGGKEIFVSHWQPIPEIPNSITPKKQLT